MAYYPYTCILGRSPRPELSPDIFAVILARVQDSPRFTTVYHKYIPDGMAVRFSAKKKKKQKTKGTGTGGGGGEKDTARPERSASWEIEQTRVNTKKKKKRKNSNV